MAGLANSSVHLGSDIAHKEEAKSALTATVNGPMVIIDQGKNISVLQPFSSSAVAEAHGPSHCERIDVPAQPYRS